MADVTDQTLLRSLAGGDDPEALGELAVRYGGLVYSSALKQVRDPHLAEDITQAVFIVLMRKARSIHPDTVLASWLFTVTRHAVQNARRMQARRRHHEMQVAGMFREAQVEESDADDRIPQTLLLEAISRLSEIEQNAVLLRFFQRRSHRELAEMLSLSEEASRKRLQRALSRMRQFLEGRGVSAGGLTMASTLARQASVSAPAALVRSIVSVAWLSKAGPTATQAAVNQIAKGASRMIFFTEMKTAIIAGATVLLVGIAAAEILKNVPATAPSSQPAMVAAEKATDAAPDASGEVVADVSKDIKIHILGVSPFEGGTDSWYSAAGQPIKAPEVELPEGNMMMNPPPTHQILLRIEKPDSVMMRVRVVGGFGGGGGGGFGGFLGQSKPSDVVLSSFTPAEGQTTATLEIKIAQEDWKTIVTNDKCQDGGDFDTKDYGTFSFQPVEDGGMDPGGFPGMPAQHGKSLATVTVSHGNIAGFQRIVLVDKEGKIHANQGMSMQSNGGGQAQSTYHFDLHAADVKQVLVQVRRFNKMVEVKDISVEKGRITKPTVSVVDLADEAQK